MGTQGKDNDVVAVIVPFPAQGHLNQLLHLSRLLSDRLLPVHFVGSATHNRQAKLRVEGWDPLYISTIHFHDLPFPPFLIPPPDPHATIKFPAHLQPAFDASAHLSRPLAALLCSLCATSRRVVVIHDCLMSFAARETADIPNAESYCFHSVSVFAHFFFELEAKGRDAYPHLKVPELPPLSFEGCFTPAFAEFINCHLQMLAASTSGHIYNTCRPVEAEFIDLMAQGPFSTEKMWAFGPFNPTSLKSRTSRSNTISNQEDSHKRHACLEWLDKQPTKSVIYVSFGTMSSISDEQICEIATGLESSGQRFVWVVREADRGDIFAVEGGEEEEARKMQLPQGYEKRVAEVGTVVRDWAPQMEILSHPSVGGFMSHCGWNSCMESMTFGVPMAAWPMHSDQPRNAMLVTEVLKIGVMVWEWPRREEMASAEAVKVAVRRLMASEEGMEMRKRAEELGREVGKMWLEGGSSAAAMDSFISHILRE